MLLELKQIQETEIVRSIINFDLDDLIFLCTCNHLDTGHINCKGKCDYENCLCLGFRQKDFQIDLVLLTIADDFSYENPELIEDSPQWWIKLGEKLNESRAI